jgi:drug/metabolite transporter (DMT)-like permease
VLASICWGIDNNWTALIGGFTPAQGTVAKGLIAGAVNLSIGLAFERPGLFDAPGIPWGLVGGALALGSLTYGASIALYILGAQRLGASRSQLLFSTAPFLGLGLSWLVLGEPVLPAQVVAGAALAIGVVLLASTRARAWPRAARAHAPASP